MQKSLLSLIFGEHVKNDTHSSGLNPKNGPGKTIYTFTVKYLDKSSIKSNVPKIDGAIAPA